MKEKILNILEDYRNDLKKFIGLTKYKIRGYIKRFNQSLEDPANRRRYLFMASAFVLLVLLSNVYSSYGYYNDALSFPIVQAKVGNMYINQNDYVLLVYLEDSGNDGAGNGKYHLVSDIPTIGYHYSGYNCKNNSTLTFNDDLLTTSVNLTGKDICSIYFDLTNKLDLTINVMLEDTPGSDTYSLGKRIPAYGYVYSHYECANGGEIYYDANLHKARLSSPGKDFCSIYFVKEKSDINIDLYVENTLNQKDYIERVNIPSNVSYHLNKEDSYCVNAKNERVDDVLNYNNGYIETESSEIISCKVYLDRDE